MKLALAGSLTMRLKICWALAPNPFVGSSDRNQSSTESESLASGLWDISLDNRRQPPSAKNLAIIYCLH
jgi:hypothetical protein